MLLRTKLFRLGLPALALLALASAGLVSLAAQDAPQQRAGDEFTLSVDVDLVVLHTTVADKNGRLISELNQEHFRIYEDGVQQKLAVFRNEDVPVTVGLVLDNSASMRENRSKMMAGALRFVQTSNPLDEIFVVNFNDDYYLDLQGKDFTSDLADLKEALDRTTSRGSTSFYDALRASVKHSQRGTRQKRVLLVMTDGVDTTSVTRFETVVREGQQAEVAMYIIKLPCAPDEDGRACRRSKRYARKLAEISGGIAYFPTSIEEVESLCQRIAHDIRNQYVLGYYPTNRARDGSFREVRVELLAPKSFGKLYARTRPGYYAPGAERTGSR